MSLTIEPTIAPPCENAWAEHIPDDQWTLEEKVLDEATASGLPFMLGGAFALAAYTGRWRNTKDLDLFVLPEEREAMVEMLTDLGLQDYYDQKPYERHWIYRAVCGDKIVDVIWQMANRRASVAPDWLDHASTLELRGRTVKILSPEELVWTKLYVMQRERCDWPDLLNVLYRTGRGMDWDRLLEKLGEDAPLLGGLLQVFGWLCPERALQISPGLWRRLGLAAPEPGPACAEDRRRVDLLDTRDWFGPSLPPGELLKA